MITEGSKRKLSAILSADAKEYSRLMSQDERGTIRTLTAYKEAMSILIQEYKGRVVDSPGDNLLAEFGSVIDAVNCSVEIQRDFAEKNAELPPARQMEFRIGINLGDVVEKDGRIYGDGVNIAARVESLAEGRGICISGTVHDQVKNRLGLEYEYLGEQTVKNIPEPVRVYRILSYPGAAAYRVVKAKKIEGKKWLRVAIISAFVLIAGSASVLIWRFSLQNTPSSVELATESKVAYSPPDKPSIAVLPFVNVGGDKEQEYFSDGMTDDLITDLSKVSGLFVIARNSVFTYKGKPVRIQQVGRELGVRYVLEGSVRRVGNQVRINAQLIDATTGHHLWAERYDSNIGNVFALQDRITGNITAALAVKLTSGEKEQVARKYTDNVTAYDAFLQGRAHYVRRTPEDYAKAVSYFERAVELDPNYGQAYAALALTYWESSHNLWTFNLGVAWWEARERASRYLGNAMKRPSALVHQAASKMLIDRYKHKEAIDEAQQAIALDPNDANSYLAMAYALIYDGRPKESLKFIEKAMRLDPYYPPYYLFVLGLANFVMERFETAAILFERALKRNPENYVPLIPLAAAHAYLNRKQEAAATIEELQKALPIIVTLSTVRESPLWSYKNPKDKNRLLDGLRKAGMQGTPYDALRQAK